MHTNSSEFYVCVRIDFVRWLEKSFEICACLWQSLIVLRWLCGCQDVKIQLLSKNGQDVKVQLLAICLVSLTGSAWAPVGLLYDNNWSICKVQTLVHRDYAKHIHMHTHRGTCTHEHSDNTKLNLHSLKWAAETWGGWDSSMEQKTWQVYSFGKRNVFRLHLSESAFHPVWPVPLCTFPQGKMGQGSRCLVVYTNCSSRCVLFLWQKVPSKHAWSHCQYGQCAARIRQDRTSCIWFGSILSKKARIVMCNLSWRT